jgi:hypothetical protein
VLATFDPHATMLSVLLDAIGVAEPLSPDGVVAALGYLNDAPDLVELGRLIQHPGNQPDVWLMASTLLKAIDDPTELKQIVDALGAAGVDITPAELASKLGSVLGIYGVARTLGSAFVAVSRWDLAGAVKFYTSAASPPSSVAVTPTAAPTTTEAPTTPPTEAPTSPPIEPATTPPTQAPPATETGPVPITEETIKGLLAGTGGSPDQWMVFAFENFGEWAAADTGFDEAEVDLFKWQGGHWTVFTQYGDSQIDESTANDLRTKGVPESVVQWLSSDHSNVGE